MSRVVVVLMTIGGQFSTFSRIDCISARGVGYCSAAESKKKQRHGTQNE